MYLIKEDRAISYEDSLALKGLAILLIVFAHNKHIVPEGGYLYRYFYSFHIYIFFILPFFYKRKDLLSKTYLLNLCIRHIVPYFIFFCFCFFVNNVLATGGFSIKDFVIGFFNINGETAGSVCGATFLWFLPSFMWLSIIRILVLHHNVAFVLFLFLSISLSIDISVTWHVIYKIIPLYFARGLYYFAYAIIAIYLANNVKNIEYISIFIFFSLSILYFLNINMPYFDAPYALSGFFSIKYIASRVKGKKIYKLLGENSLQIYLFHLFIYELFNRLLVLNYILASLVFFLTIAISLLLSVCLRKFPRLNLLLFPRNIENIRIPKI